MGPKIYVAVEVFSQLFLRWCTPVMHPMSPSFTKPFKSLMLCTTGPLALLSSISRAYFNWDNGPAGCFLIISQVGLKHSNINRTEHILKDVRRKFAYEQIELVLNSFFVETTSGPLIVFDVYFLNSTRTIQEEVQSNTKTIQRHKLPVCTVLRPLVIDCFIFLLFYKQLGLDLNT